MPSKAAMEDIGHPPRERTASGSELPAGSKTTLLIPVAVSMPE
jgi:hypothetical protein